ncbi:MAG TPA: lamin tail domain-containing protein, partial [Candidatus Saccharimonadales bacterium]|nr:lamin tail domain-containing protein [Candidatus Saccharimonadales bacterium]
MKRVLLLFPLALASWLPSSALAADSVVVFNEVHYHPPTNEAAGEWIELHNQMTIDIDLSAWRVSGDAAFTFAEGTILAGGGYLVLAADPAALQTATGLTNVLGPFTGRLNNASGSLRLRDRNDRLMDSLDYRDGGKWPLAADGSGATLAKRDPDSTSEEPEHWASSVVTGGTPGRRNFPVPVPTPRRGLVPFDTLWRFEASGTDLGASWRAPGFDDSAWSGRNRATLISYWPFDGSATAVRGTNGALVGAVATAADRNGLAGGALSFNGSLVQYVSVPGGGGLNGAVAGTVSLWVKWTGTQDADCCGSFGAVLARQANGLFSDNVLALNNPNPAAAVVTWRQSGASGFLITGTTVVGTNWHHLAVTFSSAGSVLYLDGAVQGRAVGPALNNNASIPLTIGAWSGDGAGYSTSTIDDVAVWDQPLSAEQVGQLAAQTRTPLDFTLPETAAYFAGNGRLAVNDELRHTALPLGPNTYYFRTTFQLADDPTQTQLRLDLAVNDGAVFYLNGAEIYRHNMPPGPVSYATPASSPVGDAPLLSDLPVPAAALVLGTNTLAVEVHQADAGDPGMVFGAGLSGLVHLPVPLEERSLIGLNDVWKVEASNTDLGPAWRAPGYSDASWSNAPALFWAGNGDVDGVPPELVTGVTAAASTEYVAGVDARQAINTVNGAGLTGNAHGITPGGTMWLSHGTAVAPFDLNPQITFDLGNAWPLRLMKVWNYNEFLPGRPDLLARGVASGNILAGLATNALSPLFTGQTFNIAPGTVSDFSQAIELGGVTARYVRLDQLTNFPGGDARFVGLSEVQFFRDPNLKRTQLPLGPVTYYFRKTFNFGGDPSGARLFLNSAVDDGAVFYLNGVEVRRFNLAPGPVSHFTLATQSLAHATLSGPIEIPAANLRTGPNVLAVEVHQTAADSDQDMLFGASLTAQVPPPSAETFSPGTVVFNELTAGGSSFQVELVNTGTAPVDVYGYTILRTGASPDSVFTFPDSTLGPGEFLVLSQAMLGFGVVPGDKLFLFLPSLRGVADSVEVHERPRSRSPDGIGEWLTPAGVTLGSSNSVVRHDQVVINEIFYHGPPRLEAPAVLGTNTVISLTNVWRYEPSGTDLGTGWRVPDYDDSAWASGRGMFFAGTNTLPAARNTELALGPTTYYFRTTFVYSGAPAFQSATLRYAVDDGIVVYLNGREMARFNMPTGPISYTNNASGAIGFILLRTPVNIALTNFVIGTNVLAAEVHQAVTSGDDMAFGMELSAVADAIPRIPFAESSEEWVELYNRGAQTADLTGWRLDEGIDYRFDPGTLIPPDGYLVVAKDPPALAEKFPGITIVGPYTNSLSHSGEKILLRDAADNPAYAVRYSDDGRWPEAPDGGGSSLELRDPRADPSAGEAWAASDETTRTAWRTYSYRAVAAGSAVGPDGQWREFVLGLLGPGEVWLDDISVIETPATTPVQMLQNGTFDTGTNKWRIIGN